MTDPSVECFEQIQAVVDRLIAEGKEPVFLLDALTRVAVKTAKLDNNRARAAIHLHASADTLFATAQKLRAL